MDFGGAADANAVIGANSDGAGHLDRGVVHTQRAHADGQSEAFGPPGPPRPDRRPPEPLDPRADRGPPPPPPAIDRGPAPPDAPTAATAIVVHPGPAHRPGTSPQFDHRGDRRCPNTTDRERHGHSHFAHRFVVETGEGPVLTDLTHTAPESEDCRIGNEVTLKAK